jgi:hypothetical protein
VQRVDRQHVEPCLLRDLEGAHVEGARDLPRFGCERRLVVHGGHMRAAELEEVVNLNLGRRRLRLRLDRSQDFPRAREVLADGVAPGDLRLQRQRLVAARGLERFTETLLADLGLAVVPQAQDVHRHGIASQ